MQNFSRLAKATALALGVALPMPVMAQSVQQDACRLSVFFPNGVSGITASQRNAITAFVQGSGDTPLSIVGYASSVGQAAANLRLSQTRASNVEGVVTSAGFGSAAQGQGEAGPGAANRRVDIVRSGCGQVVQRTSGLGAAAPAAAGGAALLLLLMGDNSSSSSTSSTSGTGN